MPKRKETRNAHGSGSIRHLPSKNAWEARYTIGRDPGTGKQIQKSVYGKSEAEVRKKLAKIIVSIDEGAYTEPSRLTVAQWLDIWTAEYLGELKVHTLALYKKNCRLYIKPALGAVKLQTLATHSIQIFYNKLQRENGLAPKTVKNVHGVLHRALSQAMELGYIKNNPSEACKLPRIEKREMVALPDEAISEFLEAIQGHKYENLYFVDLFTGMRKGEILGLSWDMVDFDKGTITINKQLQKEPVKDGEYRLVATKTDKVRKITPASAVMERLKVHQLEQKKMQLVYGAEWSNPMNLVFTHETGKHYAPYTVYKHLKQIVATIGIPEARFHDLRHSYALAALQSGDDIKTVQENLGHHTAAFTLDVYGHVSERMKRDSANRMDSFIKKAQGSM